MECQWLEPHGRGGGAGDGGGPAEGQLTLLPAAGPQVSPAPPTPNPALPLWGTAWWLPTPAPPSQHLLPHSLGGLRERLARQGTVDVHYMIINEKAPLSRAMFGELERQASPGIPVFQPEPEEPDVWQVLGGDKDDFLVYDR